MTSLPLGIKSEFPSWLTVPCSICKCLGLSPPMSCHSPSPFSYSMSMHPDLLLLSQVHDFPLQDPCLYHTSLPLTPVSCVPFSYKIYWLKAGLSVFLTGLHAHADKDHAYFCETCAPSPVWACSQPSIPVCWLGERKWEVTQFSGQHCACSSRNVPFRNLAAGLQIRCPVQSKYRNQQQILFEVSLFFPTWWSLPDPTLLNKAKVFTTNCFK